MTTYITTNANSHIELLPGKLYAADFEVDMANAPLEFDKAQKNKLEGELKAKIRKLGHECKFADFSITWIWPKPMANLPLSVTGSFEFDRSSATTIDPPRVIVRVYFRIASITGIILFGIIAAILTTTVMLVSPKFIGLLEATDNVIDTTKDLFIGVVQEPRKILELGVVGFIPIIALMAGIGYFILKRKAA